MNPALVAEMLKPRDEEIVELKRQKDALMEELENIATAEWREFDPDTRRCAYEFVLWAQSRARHTINRVLSGDVTAPLPEDVKLVQVGPCACSDHECGECMQPTPSKVGAGGTATLRHNAKVRGPEAALSPEAPSRLPGSADC